MYYSRCYAPLEKWLEKYPNDRFFAPIIEHCPPAIKPQLPADTQHTELEMYTFYIKSLYGTLPFDKMYFDDYSPSEIATIYEKYRVVMVVKAQEMYEKYRALAATQPTVDSDLSLAPYLNNYDMTTDYHTNTTNTKTGTVSNDRAWSENRTSSESLTYSKLTEVASDENPETFHNQQKESYNQGANRSGSSNVHGSTRADQTTFNTLVRGTSDNSNVHKYGYWTNVSMPDTFEKIRVLVSREFFDEWIRELLSAITLSTFM